MAEGEVNVWYAVAYSLVAYLAEAWGDGEILLNYR
jgi:hypothetical protein